MNNKTLGLIFAGLLALFFISKMFSGNKDRSFDADVLAFSKDKITKLEVTPKDQETFTIEKNGSDWIGKKGALQVKAMNSTVDPILEIIDKMKILRIAAIDEAKHPSFEIDDVTARASLKIYEGSNPVKEYVIGGFRMNQETRSAKSFIRLANDPKVYVMDGFASFSLSQGFDSYRDRLVLQFDAEAVNKITWNAEVASGSVERTLAGWTSTSGEILDSTKVENFVRSMSNFSASGFNDNYTSSSNTGNQGSIEIALANRPTPIVLNVFEVTGSDKPLVLHTTEKEDTYFTADSTSVVARFFKSIDELQ